jgi:hypothetical protein
MFKKTLIAAAALAVTGTAAFAGGYNSYRVDYNTHNYQQTYQPQYKTVCEPVYETRRIYDSYSYRYITQQVFVGNKCYLVRIY